jgi:hypothetical protein
MGTFTNLLVAGHMNFGKFRYSDESGFDLDTQILAFHLKI